MSFRLKIGKVIDIDVSFEVREGQQYQAHKVGLVLKRLDAAQFDELMQRARDGAVDDFALLGEMIVAWRQDLVVDDADQPVAYSAEALECLCGVLGVRRLLAEKAIAAQLEGVRSAAADKQGN
jgi:hypothetical protein